MNYRQEQQQLNGIDWATERSKIPTYATRLRVFQILSLKRKVMRNSSGKVQKSPGSQCEECVVDDTASVHTAETR